MDSTKRKVHPTAKILDKVLYYSLSVKIKRDNDFYHIFNWRHLDTTHTQKWNGKTNIYYPRDRSKYSGNTNLSLNFIHKNDMLQSTSLIRYKFSAVCKELPFKNNDMIHLLWCFKHLKPRLRNIEIEMIIYFIYFN